MKFQGIVLAGGKSSRFGEDKALALVDGIPMIQRAVHLLTELHLDPCVITNPWRDYSFLNCRIERDLIPDKGPIGGLYTGCCLFERLSLVVLTCDMPALTAAAVEQLIENHKAEHGATCYRRNGILRQPFPGVYEAALRDTIGKFIEMEQLSMQDLLNAIPEMTVVEFSSGERMLLNINEKKDLDFH